MRFSFSKAIFLAAKRFLLLPSLLFQSCLLLQASSATVLQEVEKAPLVSLETTQGTFVVELFSEKAPKACENFLALVKAGYYDGIRVHRIIPGFMIQSGDPTGTGSGGASIWKKPFQDEFSPSLSFDQPGILAMANAGPDSNGSQFFITVSKTSWLNKKHTIFGCVKSGYDVVLKLSYLGKSSGHPSTEERILRAKVL